MNRIFKFFAACLAIIAFGCNLHCAAQDTDSLVTVNGVNYIISNGKASIPCSSTNNGQGGVYSGNLVIPAYIEVDGAFYDVTRVEDHAFYHNTELESVTFESTSMDYIGPAAFQGDESLHTINLPASLADMGEWTFADCPQLQTIQVPEGVTTIWNSVFKNCTALYQVTLPSTVTSLAIDVFYNTPALSVVFLNASEPPSNSQSPIATTATTTVVVPDDYVGNYSPTWAGALVKSRSNYETPTNKSALQDYINMVSESGSSYEGGTTPGTYPEDKVTAYENALIAAVQMLEEDHTEDEYLQAYNNLVALQQDLEKSVNPIIEGYYRIVSAYPGFLNSQGVEKAMSVKGSNLTWETLNESNPNQIFRITPLGSNYSIQNYTTSQYIRSSNSASISQPVYTSPDQEIQQTITPIGSLQYLIANTFYDVSYHPEGHSYGGGNKGNIVTWNDNDLNGMSTWYVRYIGQEVPDSIAQAKEQANIDANLSSLITEANSLKAKTITYIRTGNLITEANDNNEARNQFSSNAKDPVEGTYAALIDGNYGADAPFFHSNWHEPDLGIPHYLQVDLRTNPVSEFDLLIARRPGYYGLADAPTGVKLQAANDTASWDSITMLSISWDPDQNYQAQTLSDINLGASYRYLRFTVLTTRENRHGMQAEPFFSLSEFQITGLTLDRDHSQYYYLAGMKDAVDNMTTATNAASAALLNGTGTQADVDNLQKAIAAVQALYIDTVALNEAIAQGERFLNNTGVGEELGQTTQEAKDALQAVITAVKGTSISEPLVKADVDAAIQRMTAANSAFARSIHSVKPDTWYYIVSTAQYREGEAGQDDAACKDHVIYANGENEDDDIQWGLNDEGGQAYLYDARSMWRFIPVDSTDYYYVQNLGNGFYMGEGRGSEVTVKVSYDPVPYSVNSLGGGQFELVPANSGSALPLHAKGSNNKVVTYDDGGQNSASSWTFSTVINGEASDMMLVRSSLNNFTDVLCLPYNFGGLSDVNDDVHTYAIKNITQETNDEGQLVSTIELYEKDEFQAGEPCILWIGNPDPNDSINESLDIVLPFPSSVTSAPVNGNGISGCLHGQGFGAGTAFSTGKQYVVATDGVGIGAQTGVIDPATFRGAVEGVQTARTLTLVGLNPLPSSSKADVNGDGQVNSSDVVAIYNYISDPASSGLTLEQADVNEDGQVNSSDAVAVYNQIAGASASKGFSTLLKLK